MGDKEDVAAFEASVREARARSAAFQAATDQIVLDPVNELVVPVFDSDGCLKDLHIDPVALTDYTNVELEQIVTDVLRRTRDQVRDTVVALFERYLVPSSPLYQEHLDDEHTYSGN